ncbi:MAG: hypothetical protein Q9166_000422 [cf. Caloplaca sp. 2 TL-2023]
MARKSNVSQVSATGEEGTPAKEKADGVNIEALFSQDLSLPRTMVQRLAKGVLPPNTQIQKDAIIAMSKGATVFVNHIADKANELTLGTNRKTISPMTVLEALAECEYEEFLPRVKAELDKFNEIATGKRNEYRRKLKEKDTGVAPGNDKKNGVNGNVNGEVGANDEAAEREGEERASKRMRREEGFEEAEVGQVQGQKACVDGTPEEEDEERYDTAMEDEGDGGRADRRESIQEDDASQEGSGEEDDEVSEDELVEDERADSDADMDSRSRAIQDGLSSGVDDGSESD